MKNSKTHFQVDSRIARLLSQEYSSSEKALKELVDNAWDADADSVNIVLPEPTTTDPIIIEDDGSGMTPDEVRQHYLAIAADRRVLRGPRTITKKRMVKGRKGIGKFAGLMATSTMTLETSLKGTCSSFTLRLEDLATVTDIEHLPITLNTAPCDPDIHGTRITLTNLHTGFNYPDPKKFRQILLLEYGREAGMIVNVNGKPLGVDDVDGTFQYEILSIGDIGDVRLKFAISENKSVSRQPGIVIRVDGKAIGKPSFLGLDELDDFPQKLLKRLYGEIDADELRDHVTAGWDSLVENSTLLMKLIEHVKPIIHTAFQKQYYREINIAKGRLKRAVHDRLASLPENRREYADRAIKKVLDRFFAEPPEKIEAFVFVLLEAIEHSDYGAVLEHLAGASKGDVAAIADVLDEFGLAELAYLVVQAKARTAFLDQLEILVQDPKTLEATMHKSIEKNLWIFGIEYSLFSSNKTLRRQIEDMLGKEFTGSRAEKRPDLLLNENLHGECLLIEFKRPSHSLNRDDYTQATNYRHDLAKVISKEIRVLVIGGRRSSDFPSSNREANIDALTFDDVIATARRQLEWQLRTRE